MIKVLLIGINHYLSPKINALRGCTNDVKLLHQLYTDRFAIPENQIKVLINDEATKNNIVTTFQSHLQTAKAGDSVVFYFSGHGSREPAHKDFWTIDTDKALDTLVCYDSGVEATLLADKELRFLLSELPQDLSQVVVIIDSCHSGSVTRTSKDIRSRHTFLLTQPRQSEDFIFYRKAKEEGWADNLGQVPQGKHILLSACRSTETSIEKSIRRRPYGVFTYSLASLLNRQSNGLNYFNLFNHVRRLTRQHNLLQTPQIYSSKSEIKQLFLGNEKRSIGIIASYENDAWWLSQGFMQGLGEEDQLILTVDPELSFSSKIVTVCESLAGKSKLYDSTVLQKLDKKQNYPATLILSQQSKLKFSINAPNDCYLSLLSELETLHKKLSPSLFITHDESAAEYQIVYEEGKFFIGIVNELSFKPLFEPKLQARETLFALEHIQRWEQKLALENIEEGDLSRDSVQLFITVNGREYCNEDIVLDFDGKQGIKITISARCNPDNLPAIKLYGALLLFDKGRRKIVVDANEALLIPSSGDSEKCQFNFLEGRTLTWIISDALLSQGIQETTDYIKLIISDSPFDANLLEQGAIEEFNGEYNKKAVTRSSLNHLLNQAIDYSQMRSSVNHTIDLAPQWFCQTIEVTTRLVV
ncbi:MAG: caspase family protein [Thiotrichaceae bacterium]|nr:caspase family protein [Thiotrichaceae bacterium]